jgi:hypothetical protein
MAFDFANLIQPERREAFPRRLDAEHRETARFYTLSDRWLSQELFQLARAIRANAPGLASVVTLTLFFARASRSAP